jgi:WW domain
MHILQTQVSFFACPATGQVSWDPPIGNFVYVFICAFFVRLPMRNYCRLPPSENGEWWEISDESRGGIPYYYHTKTGETVWEKPDGFVIPLAVLQVCTLLPSVYSSFFSNCCSLEHRVGSPSLKVIFFYHRPEPVYACNCTRTTSRGSTFTFTCEGSSRFCSVPWPATDLCKRFCRHHQEKSKWPPRATQPCY